MVNPKCYWYANTIMWVFQSSFPGITSQKCEASGTWNVYLIYKSEGTKELKDMNGIKKAFKQHWDYVVAHKCMLT